MHVGRGSGLGSGWILEREAGRGGLYGVAGLHKAPFGWLLRHHGQGLAGLPTRVSRKFWT
jgi:hypothetical protein